MKTAQGLVIDGQIRRGINSANCGLLSHSVNHISVSNIKDLLIQQYNIDFPERRCDAKAEMSHVDHRLLHSVKKSAHLVDCHYCIVLPNRPVAEQCLNNLKRMLYKNPDFHNEYNRLMMEKGYAARISEKQLDRSDPSCGCQGVR